MAEVEIQDEMRLCWIRIRVGTARNTQKNQLVYPQLEVTTVGGTAYYLIKKHKYDNNRYGAWNALYKWYYGDAVNNETSDSLRSKLESYCLTSVSN